jgi:hypothetical protein
MFSGGRLRPRTIFRAWRGVVALAAAVTLSIGLAALSAKAEDKPIKIGVLAALSGPGAADGEETVRGATLAAEEICPSSEHFRQAISLAKGGSGSSVV